MHICKFLQSLVIRIFSSSWRLNVKKNVYKYLKITSLCLDIAPPGDGLWYYLPVSAFLFQKVDKRRFARRWTQKDAEIQDATIKRHTKNTVLAMLDSQLATTSAGWEFNGGNTDHLCVTWRQDFIGNISDAIKLTPSAISTDTFSQSK